MSSKKFSPVEQKATVPWVSWRQELVAAVESAAVQHQRAYRVLLGSLIGLAIIGGIGDIVTTSILLGHPGLYESVALTRWIITEIGLWALWPKKVILLGGAIVLSRRLVPRPLDLLPIAALAAGQCWLTIHNLQVGLAVGAL